MPKHAAELNAALMMSCATGRDTLNVQQILEDSDRLTEPPFCSSTQRQDFTRCTIHRKAQLWHDRTHRKNSISVYIQKCDGVLTPKSIPAETVPYQEQTLLAKLSACQTQLLPRERRQYNEVAISMVTTTRSTG